MPRFTPINSPDLNRAWAVVNAEGGVTDANSSQYDVGFNNGIAAALTALELLGARDVPNIFSADRAA